MKRGTFTNPMRKVMSFINAVPMGNGKSGLTMAPTTETTPPIATRSSASATVSVTPTASITLLAPRPSLSS